MKSGETRIILEKLLNSFNSSLTEGQAREWYEYLLTEDFGVAKTVATWYQLHSDQPFMPNISQFNAKLKAQQMEVSRRELARRDMAACLECSGLTWLEDSTGMMPCPQCRPTSFTLWEQEDYRPGVPPSPDELDGPKQAYQMASEPRITSGPAVSVERAMQWKLHLLSTSTSVYPEGDTLVTSEKENHEF